ncbi:MAG: hypothetical protein J3Q66DRAFT_324578 [Benniella sp.]|nr:MAG: hypothetical protein J3Q66DRAFT_324578 [Benniella sp.]
METSAVKTTYPQQFRDPFTSTTVLIPTRFDKRTEERFILWEDIQATFKDANYATYDGEVVLFTVDDNFKHLTPRRIAYYPGAILDVVVSAPEQAVRPSFDTQSQAISVAVSTAGSPNLTQSTSDCKHIDTIENGEAVISVWAAESSHTPVEHVDACLMASNVKSSSDTKAICPQGHDRVATVFQQLSELTDATAQVMDKGRDRRSSILVAEARRSLQQFRQLVKRSSSGISLSDRLARMSIVVSTKDNSSVSVQDATFHILQKMMDSQQQILNRQVSLQKNVKAVGRQTYELFEYPIPRLFVVLPKPRRRRDAVLRPFRKQFRLFFLCECSSHTEDGWSTHPHGIHLAKHEGYDLDNVDEFFEKYGSHVLKVMKMLKIGLSVAGVAVPGLSHLELVEGIESTAKALEMASRNCRPLIDDVTASIRTQLKGDNELMEKASVSGQMRFNSLKALEGSDLRQLESYLRNHDSGRVLGNLNRIVTHDGDVRWVCNDHYHKDYSKDSVLRFKDIVKASGGMFLEQDGWVTVDIKRRAQAKEFYEAMVKTPGVRTLLIALRWEVTQADLEALEAAVTKTGVTRLFLFGTYAQKSGLSFLRNNKRYNPIVRLMCNGHLESMDVNSFADFYQRITDFPMTMTSRLEELRIHSRFSPSDRTQKSALKFILKHSPYLRDLRIATKDLYNGFKFLMDQASSFPNLETIAWDSPEGPVTMKLSQGITQRVEMTMLHLNSVSRDVQRLIQQGYVTELDIHQTIDETNRSHMVDILRQTSRLVHVKLRVHPQLIATVITLATAARRTRIMDEVASSTTCDALKVSIDWQDPGSLSSDSMIRIILDFPDNSATPAIELCMRDTMPPEMTEHVLELVRNHGSSIEILKTNRLFTDDFAIALDSATREKGCKIVSLHLCPRSMTLAGLECVGRVIERSNMMSELHFNFLDLQDKPEREKAVYLLRRYGKSLHSLSITGNFADEWLSEIADVCPTRHELPELTSFGLNCSFDDVIPVDCGRWIRRMLSSPSDNPVSVVNQDEPLTECTMDSPWQPLREVILQGQRLENEDMKAVIEAFDQTFRQIGSDGCRSIAIAHLWEWFQLASTNRHLRFLVLQKALLREKLEHLLQVY